MFLTDATIQYVAPVNMKNVHKVPILAFHKIDSRFEFGVTRNTPSQFRRVLRFLKKQGYVSVRLEDLGNPDLPEKPVVITFDDSYESVYTNAFPIMKEFGFTGTVFIVSGYAGRLNDWDVNLGGLRFRHLSWAQINELQQAGFELGSHSVHHTDLVRTGTDRIRFEIWESKKEIEDHTGSPVRFFSFPFGRYNPTIVDQVRDAGYEAGVGLLKPVKLRPDTDSFVLERKAYYLIDGLFSLKHKLESKLFSPLENAKLRVINFCSHASSLVKREEMWLYSSSVNEPIREGKMDRSY